MGVAIVVRARVPPSPYRPVIIVSRAVGGAQVSWLIAFFEYCLQVPANRLGHEGSGGPFSAPVLKVIQELVSLTAFAIFSTYVLQERLRWTDGLGFVFILAGVGIAMGGREIAARRGADADAARPYQALAPPELELAPPPPHGGTG